MAHGEIPSVVYPFQPGLTGFGQVRQLALADGSYNFYPDPDNEGYLVNYPGSTDIFYRPEGDPPSYLGTPPDADVPITRVLGFRDSYGKEHIVFVRGREICVKVGNGYEVLYAFKGINYGGSYYPAIFVHESKLIICNQGDPPLLWDGYKKPHPLGVREVPNAPTAWGQKLPAAQSAVSTDSVYEHGSRWWPQEIPASGPSNQYHTNADGSTDEIRGVYQIVSQFIDDYGNRGRASAPSRFVYVPHKGTHATHGFDKPWMLHSETTPPLIEEHITGQAIGRTLNLDRQADVGGLSGYNIFYEEVVFDNVTESRFIHQIRDSELADNDLIDLTVGPPDLAGIGCSWNGRIFLAGHADPKIVSWSDYGMFGQFRATQQHNAQDHVTAIVSMGDRVAIITRSSTEVVYDANGTIAVLEQTQSNGSLYGRSFVDVGGAIFGLWSTGFGFYDGTKYEFVDAPYFVRGIYNDTNHFVYGAVKIGHWYMVSIRKDSSSESNNFVLMYHLLTKQWYLIKDSILDITSWREQVLVSNLSIYEMFRGDYASDAVLSIEGLLPPEGQIHNTRPLNGVRLLMEPSSNLSVAGAVWGRYSQKPSFIQGGMLIPSESGKSFNKHPVPHWNAGGVTYNDEPPWSAPGDFWVHIETDRGVEGNYHDLKLVFPPGHRVRVKALEASFGQERRG